VAWSVARDLLGDPPRMERMALAGREFVQRHVGSTQRIIDLIKIAD
jgi:hypothetical protein